MKKLVRFLKRLISDDTGGEAAVLGVEELRTLVRARYHSFKVLLSANNKALEIMSNIEQALRGAGPFGMSFVRSAVTGVSVNVFRMIQSVDQLAPGKYAGLYAAFEAIQPLINEAITVKDAAVGDRLVLPLESIDRTMVDRVGSKMANVAEIRNEVHLPVPAGFAITSLAFELFMQHNDLQAEIDRRVRAMSTSSMEDLFNLSADLQQLIIRAPVPEDLERAVLDAYRLVEREACREVKVSLRSSAVGEDAAGTTFAGQFHTELNVSEENLLQAYKQVIASKYALPGMTYRLHRGIPDEAVPMCVGCMVMVSARSGGVMYSRDPMNIRNRSVVINSVWGLPKAVVDGSVDPDVFVVAGNEPAQVVEKKIKIKGWEFSCFPEEGVCRNDLTGDKAAAASISDEEAVRLADMAVRLEEHYGSAQDIEWAIDADGAIHLLQCRPLQQMEAGSNATSLRSPADVTAAVLARGGVTASPGVASGPVFLVRSDMDKLRFPQGAILVTAQSLPAWAPLLGRAAAVVTEVGGVAGHLANVAREFGVPALFGVAEAVDNLVHGQTVTVDADGLTIYEGRVEPLLTVQETRKNLMEGSPVYESLKAAAAHIVPLTLLDPEAAEFRPANCKTLHDITRFIHEKSVQEMFNFGKDHRFQERSSKQLLCKVPMQWWVLNLDDGFKEEVSGRFVSLDNIVSVPMLALWEGITAVPWGGPPPVDAKGLMSVLFEATTNPALDPSLSSAFAVRNYFMVSRNFCSLSSRFGFHFSTVEALIGDDPFENYVSFVFKEGAADYVRRVRRATLISQIVEEFGFRSEVKEDSLFAKLEGRDQDYMKTRLKIVGYLTIHTRQLDMVMADESEMSRYRAKFFEDIQSFLNLEPSRHRGTPAMHAQASE
ncbi:MAG: pyruvate, water dikinase [Desulfomonile tiedjei]|nr:pyruvate, water dikinase [Desulfomonile tiedjei]